MERPWLSVIMPTFNGARFVGQALESVVGQNDGGIEVVAVDDGSLDQTRRILAGYARRLRMQVLDRPHSGNWVEATALGMSAARGDYLCWLHQDDLWRPNRIARLRRLAATHRQAALIVHPSWYVDARGRRIGYWHCPLPRVNRPLRGEEVLERLLVQCSIASPATMFSAGAAARVGLPDARLTYSADWDYWLRLARLGATVYCPTPLACFRIHEASQTISRADQAGERRAQQLAVLERHLPHLHARRQAAEQVAQAARFSIELNHALTGALAGRAIGWRDLTAEFAWLGAAGWQRMLRDSRIIERCLSRIQVLGVRPAIHTDIESRQEVASSMMAVRS